MSTYSTNLALELIGNGEQAGNWGQTTNTNLGTLVEQAISGYTTQAITDGSDTTLTMTQGASATARNMYIELTGTLTAARNLIVPSNRKLYFIFNNTTGGFAVTVKVSGQTGVSVPNGTKTILVCNGTDIVLATTAAAPGVTSVGGTGTVSGITLGGTVTSTGNLTLTGTVNVNSPAGTLPIANGGTGTSSTTYCSLTSNVSGQLPIANGGTGSSTLAGAGIPTLTANNAFTQSSFGATTSAGSTQALVVRPNASGGGTTVGLLTQNNGTSTGMVIFTDSTGTRLSSYNFSGSEVGYITTNGSTCTLNNFSDYRLKENVLAFTGAAIRVKQLKPKTFTWIKNPSVGVAEGFLAHELQEVVPNAVHGAKDAVDENNQPEYQGVDTTALIPLLTAALQEALSRIEALEAKVG
jgi:hypothetical protein